jgi:hypothetical protein
VIAYLGGGHAQKDWYQEKIKSYNIPTFYKAEDVLRELLVATGKLEEQKV